MKVKNTLLPALFVMLLWGSLFPVVKLGYGEYQIKSTGDILFFAGVRFTVSGILISLFAFLTDKPSFTVAKKSLMPIFWSGFFLIVLHYSFTYLGLELTDSSKTAIIKQSGALFYVCFSFLFFKDDKLTARKLISALVGFAGIIAINADSGGISFKIGDALIILASFCTVFSNVISKNLFKSVEPITATGISQLFGGIILLVAGICMGGRMNFTIEKSFVLIYICLASMISYCIWYTIMKKGDLSNLYIIKFAEPLFACIFGAIILGENIFKIQYLVAFLLIAGGIYYSNK